MLIHSGLITEYLNCLKVQKWIIGDPYKWRAVDKTLNIHKQPFKISMAICCFISCIRMFHHGRVKLSHSGTEDTGGQEMHGLLGIMFTTLIVLIVHFSFEMIMSSEMLEKFFKGLAAFEMRYCDEGKGLTADETGQLKSAKRTCFLMRIVGVQNTPLATAMVAVTLPNLPMNMLSIPPGNWIVDGMDTLLRAIPYFPPIVPWIAIRTVIFVANFWFFMMTYGLGVLLTIQIIIGTNCLIVAVSMFRRNVHQLLQGRQRWKISTDKCMKTIKQYREIQLLSCYFNQIHSFVIISTLGAAIIGQIISVLGLLMKEESEDVDSSNKERQLVKYFLLVTHLEGIVLTVVCINSIFGFCGEVYNCSKKCLLFLQHQQNLQRHGLLKRMLRSLPGIKVAFGKSNYIDKLTPVQFQQFSNEKIIDTLLIRGR